MLYMYIESEINTSFSLLYIIWFFFYFTDRLVHSLEYNKLKALKPVSSLHLYFFLTLFLQRVKQNRLNI